MWMLFSRDWSQESQTVSSSQVGCKCTQDGLRASAVHGTCGQFLWLRSHTLPRLQRFIAESRHGLSNSTATAHLKKNTSVKLSAVSPDVSSATSGDCGVTSQITCAVRHVSVDVACFTPTSSTNRCSRSNEAMTRCC